MKFTIIPNVPECDLRTVDVEALNPDGTLKILPAAFWLDLPFRLLRVWCHFRARYAIPTEELIAFLKQEIGMASAIEIGAGAGDLGQALGIPMTDSKLQEDPNIALWYTLNGQPKITYGPGVLKLNAAEAFNHFTPEVILAAWVTQLRKKGDTDGNPWGVDEKQIVDVAKYIFIGSDSVHWDKRILKRPHRTIRAPWLVSRTEDQSLNFIKIWE